MWTLQDAKNRFSAVVEAALAGRPQQVTRRGKPAVVVLAADDYDRMLNAARREREGFVAHLMAFPAGGEPQGAETIPRAQAAPRDVQF